MSLVSLTNSFCLGRWQYHRVAHSRPPRTRVRCVTSAKVAAVPKSQPNIPRASAWCLAGSVWCAALQGILPATALRKTLCRAPTLSPCHQLDLRNRFCCGAGHLYFGVGHLITFVVAEVVIVVVSLLANFSDVSTCYAFACTTAVPAIALWFRSVTTTYYMLQALPTSKLTALNGAAVMITRITSISLVIAALVLAVVPLVWHPHANQSVQMDPVPNLKDDFASFDKKLHKEA